MSGHGVRHVALFVPTLEGGGAERTMVNLAGGMRAHGVAVDLVVANATGPYRRLLPSDVQLIDLRSPRTLASLPRLVAYLRRARPEALVSTMNHANVVAIWAAIVARVGTRVLVREADTLSANVRGSPHLRAKLLPAIMRRTYPRAAVVIAPSRGVADDLERTLGLQRVDVIHNPVVTAELGARSREDVAHPFFADGEPPVVLGVGRLEPQKDFETLVRAFALVRRRRLLRLVILGEGSRRVALENLARQLGVFGDVSLPGFADNPFAYMARAAVFVLSSRHEGLPNVLIQAMACGCPIVSTDCESGPREILEGGRLGALVPVGDADRMSDALHDALQRGGHSHHQLLEAARPYSVGVIARQYLERCAPPS